MASMSEFSIQKGCDFIYYFSCTPCEENGFNTEAEQFCTQCMNYYCINCMSKHNVLYKKHTFLGRNDSEKWKAVPGTMDALEKCKKHLDKAKEFVCVDHDELCCSVCVAVDHRQCSKMHHIPDVAKGIRQNSKYQEIPKKIAELRKQLEAMKETRLETKTSLMKTREVITDKIKTIRTTINESLDKIENTTLQELDRVISSLEESIKKDIDVCLQMNNKLQNTMDTFQNNPKPSESKLYIAYRNSQDLILHSSKHLRSMSSIVSYNVTLQEKNTIKEILSSVESFGDINMTSNTDPNHVFRVKQYNVFKMRMSEDFEKCDIRGICQLPDGELVVVDGRNSKVKLLDQEWKIVDHCDVSVVPTDVCHTNGNEIVVCGGHELHFINVTKGKLVSSRKIKLSHKCFAAALCRSQLYISSDITLYVYTMLGQLVKKMYEDKSGGKTVRKIAISNDENTIFITNTSKHQLISLDQSGNKLATLTDPDMISPSEVHVSPAGHVFVCCWDSDTVLQIEKDGKTKLGILARKEDGIFAPKALFFSSRNSSLFVSGQKNTILNIKLI